MPNGVAFPKLELPDIAGVMGAGPAAVLAEIRRSLGRTAQSIEASLPGRAALGAPRALRTPKDFIRGLEVSVERATGVVLPSISDIFPGPEAPEEVGREAPPPAPRKAAPLVFE